MLDNQSFSTKGGEWFPVVDYIIGVSPFCKLAL